MSSDVDFSSTKLLYGGTAACAADPWTAVQTLVMDDCADDAYIGVEYGDGSTDWFVTLQESYELSHVYEEVSSTGAYSVRMSLYVGGRTIRNTFKAYVKEPVSIGISAEPAGCGFTGTCTSPYGTVNVDYVLGGTAPYTISWDPPASYTVVDTECSTGNCNIQPHQYLAAGEYVAIVTDARGCIALSEPVTITRSTISITGMTETSCGAIDVDVSYNAQCEALTYHWVTTDGDPIADPTLSSQTELSSGSYWVTVTDANGCSDTASSTLSFGITNYFPRQTIVSGTQDTISWAGYPRYTEGVVSLICPDRSTRLYHGDLHDVTSASFLVSGGSSAICSLNITCNSGCTDTVGPIYYCLSSEYNRGECPRDVAGDDDEFY